MGLFAHLVVISLAVLGVSCLDENGCVFGETSFPDQGVTDTCLQMKCARGIWEWAGFKKNPMCDSCSAKGDPDITMFDTHNIGGQFVRKYRLSVEGDVIIAQDGLSVNSAFEVKANVQPCGISKAHRQLPCVQNVTYSEPGITVTLSTEDIIKHTCLKSTNPTTDKSCAIKVSVNNGPPNSTITSPKSFYATDGTVLVVNDPHKANTDSLNCVNIIGSKGLTVSLCIQKNTAFPGLTVFAMKSLMGIKTSNLYGLCDTYTGTELEYYVMSNGTNTPVVKDFTKSWNIPNNDCKTWCTYKPPHKMSGERYCCDDVVESMTNEGCNYGSKVYNNGKFLMTTKQPYENCTDITCNDGSWKTDKPETCYNQTCSCDQAWSNTFRRWGCILGEPHLPGMACNCTLTEARHHTNGTCTGSIVACEHPGSYFCNNPGTGLGFCLQGGGNCDGYGHDYPNHNEMDRDNRYGFRTSGN